jgi:hypothetical protein
MLEEPYERTKLLKECAFSNNWLARFNIQHRLIQSTTTHQQKSSDQEAAEEYINTFEKILQPEHIYNVDETGLLGQCLPNKMVMKKLHKTYIYKFSFTDPLSEPGMDIELKTQS